MRNEMVLEGSKGEILKEQELARNGVLACMWQELWLYGVNGECSDQLMCEGMREKAIVTSLEMDKSCLQE